jgi:AraC-like DNA-binding protein
MRIAHQAITRKRSDAIVHVRGIAAIPSVLESLGANPAKVFAQAKVDLALFDNHENLVSLGAIGRLVEQCVSATGCRHFGVLVGQHGGLPSFGLVGMLVRFSEDVETALRGLGTYMHHYHGGQTIALQRDHKTMVLSYALHEARVEASDQIADGALAIMYNVMLNLCGAKWRPIEVRFAHGRPRDTRPFLRFFKAPMRFDADQSALVFSAHWARHRLNEADAEIRRLLQQQVDALALDVDQVDGFPERVRSVLRTGLLTGHASADQVAALFSMHSRTLARRLTAAGTNFKTLVDEGRFEIAKQMLENTTLDVNRVAASLDYADASAFTRAFRRWSGTTPAAWRDKRVAARWRPSRAKGKAAAGAQRIQQGD